MNLDKFEKIINEAFENKEKIDANSDKSIIDAIKETIELTDQGKIRVAEKKDGAWTVNQWVKKAILLYFRINDMKLISGSSGISGFIRGASSTSSASTGLAI